MFVVNDDKSIYVTRGDMVFFLVTAEENGENYIFKPGEVVRFKVFGKKDCENVVLQKDFPVTQETDNVQVILTENDTKFGDVISKPTDYWYEVELNPFTNPQTIIGYDDDGAKIFKLYPEGDDVPEFLPDPEDVRVIDTELDSTSTRPVQNQAIARAMITLKGDFTKVRDAVLAQCEDTAEATEKVNSDLAVERARIDNLVSGATADGAEVVDIRVGANGMTYESAGTAVRQQISALSEQISALLNNEAEVPAYFGWELGGIHTSTGAEEASYSFARTGFLPIADETYVSVTIADGFGLFVYTYDAESNFIVSKYYTGGTNFKTTYGNKYRFVIDDINASTIDLTKIDTYISVTTTSKILDRETVENTLAALSAEVNDVLPELTESGLINVSAGLEAANASCKRTGYIDIRGYDTIIYKSFLNKDGCVIAFYDKDKRYITEISVYSNADNAVEQSGTVDLTDGAYSDVRYVRFSCYDNVGVFDNFYANIYKADSLVQKLSGCVETPLKGFVVNCMGDSITSEDYTKPTWWQIIAEKTGVSVNHYGQSGTTLAHTDDRHLWDYSFEKETAAELGYNPADPATWETGNCMVERVDEMDNSADAVIVMGGTNDGSVPRGAWESEDTATFFGALNVLIKKLLKAYPGKPVIFCTMLQGKETYSENVANPLSVLMEKENTAKLTLQLRAEAIKAKCRQYGLPCIDLFNESGINGVDENGVYYRDSLHPSAIGQERIANVVMPTLRTMFGI